MASALETLLQETLADLGSLSPEKVQALVQEAIKTFASLQAMGKSADPEERAAATHMANSLKEMLQTQTQALSQLASTDLSALDKGQGMFSEDTLGELAAAKDKLALFQDSLGPRPLPAKAKRSNIVYFPA